MLPVLQEQTPGPCFFVFFVFFFKSTASSFAWRQTFKLTMFDEGARLARCTGSFLPLVEQMCGGAEDVFASDIFPNLL